MSSASINGWLYDAVTTGDAVLTSPGSGQTLDLDNKAGTIVNFANAAILPNTVRSGLWFFATATASSPILDKAGNTIASMSDGELWLFGTRTGTTWGSIKLTAGGVQSVDVAFGDPNSHTSATTVSGVLANLLSNARDKCRLDLMRGLHYKISGGAPVALAAFADNASPNPGWALVDSEAQGIRWNNNATQDQTVAGSFMMPADMATNGTAVLNVIASKVGATLADATTFTCTIYEQIVGNLHDAQSNVGGVTSAMTGDSATKTVQQTTLTLASFNSSGTAKSFSFTITPTSGTLGTDDVLIHDLYISYTPNTL